MEVEIQNPSYFLSWLVVMTLLPGERKIFLWKFKPPQKDKKKITYFLIWTNLNDRLPEYHHCFLYCEIFSGLALFPWMVPQLCKLLMFKMPGIWFFSPFFLHWIWLIVSFYSLYLSNVHQICPTGLTLFFPTPLTLRQYLNYLNSNSCHSSPRF